MGENDPITSLNHVHIVGAGIAGMTAALKIAELGCKVTLYESTSKFGGQLGVKNVNGNIEERSYKIFPNFYLNFWELVKELKLTSNFVDSNNYMSIGKQYGSIVINEAFSTRKLVKTMFAGLTSPLDMVLFYYMTTKLLTYDINASDPSITSIHKEWKLKSPGAINTFESQFNKTHDMSSLSVQKFVRLWMKNSKPFFKVAKDDLDTSFIQPFIDRLEELNVEMHINHTLSKLTFTNTNMVQELQFKVNWTGTKSILIESSDYVLLTVPAHQIVKILNSRSSRYRWSRELKELKYYPVPILHIYFTSKKPFPLYHFNLSNSKYGLTCVDISNFRPDCTKSILNVVIGHCDPLRKLNDNELIAKVLEELKQYLDFSLDDISSHYFDRYPDAPIFTNSSGSWKARPNTTTEIENLFLGGVYVKHPVDMCSIEGAVYSGLLAAKTIGKLMDYAHTVKIIKPRPFSKSLLQLFRYTLFVPSLFAWSLIKINRKLKL